jgi:exonuclease III
MSHWQKRSLAEKAWSLLLEDLKPDIALVQEALPLVESEFTLWREIPGKGIGGTGIVTRGLPIREFDLETASHPGAAVVGDVELPGGASLTAISIYGALEYATRPGRGKSEGYATTSIQRILSDLTFLLDGWYGRRSIVIGGDTNITTQLQPPWTAHHQAVVDRIAAFGLIDCLSLYHRGHVQTQRHPRSTVPWQNDYIYVSKDLKKSVRACEPVATEAAWSLSQHCPVLLELEVGASPTLKPHAESNGQAG